MVMQETLTSRIVTELTRALAGQESDPVCSHTPSPHG